MARAQRILMTGAAGKIGSILRDGLSGRYALLRLLDQKDLGDPRAGEEIVLADICDRAAIERAVHGVDTICHLAGVARIGDWDRILQANIAATYDLLETARRHNVRRFVFASSHHAVGFYPRGEQLDGTTPPRPDCGYGLSKVFGEAACRMYADKFGIEVVCLRIGTCAQAPTDIRTLSTWISPRDMVQLATVALEAPGIRYEILYGVSNNDRGWWQNDRAAELGYRAQDSADVFADAVLEKNDEENDVARRFQGAAFAAADYVER